MREASVILPTQTSLGGNPVCRFEGALRNVNPSKRLFAGKQMPVSAAYTDGTGAARAALAGTPQQDVRALGIARHFLRGETIFAEGDKAAQVLRIERGTVRLCRHFANGRRAIVHFALPCDIVGLMNAPTHFLTAEAVTPVRVAAYARADIERLMDADAGIREHMMGHLSQSLLATQNLVAALGCRNTVGRLASFFLRLAGRMAVAQDGVLELAMPRKDIADHLGLSIESVCRGFAALKSRGAIDVPDVHRIVLRDMRALTILADGDATA